MQSRRDCIPTKRRRWWSSGYKTVWLTRYLVCNLKTAQKHFWQQLCWRRYLMWQQFHIPLKSRLSSKHSTFSACWAMVYRDGLFVLWRLLAFRCLSIIGGIYRLKQKHHLEVSSLISPFVGTCRDRFDNSQSTKVPLSRENKFGNDMQWFCLLSEMFRNLGVRDLNFWNCMSPVIEFLSSLRCTHGTTFDSSYITDTTISFY